MVQIMLFKPYCCLNTRNSKIAFSSFHKLFPYFQHFLATGTNNVVSCLNYLCGKGSCFAYLFVCSFVVVFFLNSRMSMILPIWTSLSIMTY